MLRPPIPRRFRNPLTEISIQGKLLQMARKKEKPWLCQPGWEDVGLKHAIFSQTNRPRCSRASFQTQVREHCSSFPKLKKKKKKINALH